MTTILITGATDGIGLALAKQYQERNCRLILVGRRPLEALSDSLFTEATYCQIDLASENCTSELSSWLHGNSIVELDLVIHNAAMGYVGAIATQSVTNLRDLIQINLWSPIALSHMLFPFVERVRGKIAFISSVATALPGPEYASYTASKAALEGFVRSWQVELAADQSPVQLQIVRPGATRTGLHAKSGADPQRIRSDRFPTPEKVATQIMRALDHPHRAATIGTMNQLVYRLAHFGDGMIDRVMDRMRRPWGSIAERRQSNGAQATQPHCVITGAADGIGRATARAFAEAGYRVTGIDVDQERATVLEEQLRSAGHDCRFLFANLAELDKIPALVEKLQAGPPIDLLIHNAGINAIGPFHESNLARQRAVVDINFVAPLLLTLNLLHTEQMAPRATFAFVSSLSRFTGYPGAAVYAATKDGIASYARSLAVAVAAQQQHVLTIYPGPTRTAHARRYSPDNRRETKRMPPEVLATHIVSAVEAHRRTLIPGATNIGAAVLGRLFPTVAEQIMRRTIYEKL